MTLEALIYLMPEAPEHITIVGTGGNFQYEATITKTQFVPPFMWQQKVKKFYYFEDQDKLEVII